MKRIQLFEFEDFDWFPSTLRSTMTKIIAVLLKLMGAKEVVANLLSAIKKKHPFSQVVDLGSGSGGIMPTVVAHLNEQDTDASIDLLLTDLHPNQAFVQSFNEADNANMTYSPMAVDASNLSAAPAGLKTMVNSFHHMPPNIAKKILTTAQANKQAFLVYEMAENKPHGNRIKS